MLSTMRFLLVLLVLLAATPALAVISQQSPAHQPMSRRQIQDARLHDARTTAAGIRETLIIPARPGRDTGPDAARNPGLYRLVENEAPPPADTG